jgi:abortive infection bacteriophage resistance protein
MRIEVGDEEFVTNDKPFLSARQQVEHLKGKGVKFGVYNEREAIEYLKKNTNYFKLRAFRTNYAKYAAGEKIGKYINLDFSYLCDLAIIDMVLRYTLLHMSLDIEHFVKVLLLRQSEANDEDGYEIVDDYWQSLKHGQRIRLSDELETRKKGEYCGALIEKYSKQYPIWVFLEIISFGRLVDFFKFCASRFNDKKMREQYYDLLDVKELRNSCAHSNCILNNLQHGTKRHIPNAKILNELSGLGIAKKMRKTKMSNERIRQIITLFHAHKEVVTSPGVHSHAAKALNRLATRMYKRNGFYQDNQMVTSTFVFMKMVIDSWFEMVNNDDT